MAQRDFSSKIFPQITNSILKLRFLIKTDPELQTVSKFPQKFVELRCNVSSCDQAVKIEISPKNLKKLAKKWQF